MNAGKSRIRLLEIVGNAIVGGMERYVANLVERLPADQFEVFCVCPFEGRFAETLRRHGCTVYFTPIGEDPSWLSIQFVCGLVRSLNIQVVHAHLANAHLLASLCSAVTGVKVLATLHGRHVTQPDFEVYRLGHSHLSVVCQNAYVHALSLGVAANELHWIPNGVEVGVSTGISGVLQRELGLADGTPLVGFVGRLAPEKNPAVFVRAMARLLAAEDTHGVIVGDGPLRTELVDLVSYLGLTGRLHFLGVRHDMAAVYASLAVLAMTSDTEGMPLALMEAMAAGVPVVATQVGGIAEIVGQGESGILVPPHQPEAIAFEVGRLLAEPARRAAIGATAQRRIATHFNLADSVQRTARLLIQLCGAVPLHAVPSAAHQRRSPP